MRRIVRVFSSNHEENPIYLERCGLAALSVGWDVRSNSTREGHGQANQASAKNGGAGL